MTEQRTNPRKIFKVKAMLAMEGAAPVLVRTVDIGANGLSVTVPHPLQTGQSGQIGFDLLVDGKAVPLQARVKVVYSIFSSGEFKAGFQFVNLDINAASQIARFMR